MYEFKTDSVLYRPLKRRKTNVLEAVTFRGLSNLRNRYEAITPASRRLNEYIALTPIPSDEAPFRVCPAKEDDLMKTVPRAPRREAQACVHVPQ